MRWERDGADWPNREASGFATTPGHRWHLQRMGDGPGLLLLHGAGASTHSFRDLLPELARDHEVMAPDLPGHGFSAVDDPGRCSLPAMAEDLERLLDETGFQPSAVVGHSAGGAIALQMALRRPRPVVGLNAALRPFRGAGGRFALAAARMLSLAPLLPRVFARLAEAPGMSRSLLASTGSRIDAAGEAAYRRLFSDPQHAAGALAMMSRWELEPLADRLASIAAPVALLAGENDRMVAPAISRDAAARMGAAFETFPGLGHLMHEEAPGLVAEAIRRRLQGWGIGLTPPESAGPPRR